MTWKPIPSVNEPHYLDTNLNQVQKCVNWYHEKTKNGLVLMSLQGYQLKGIVPNNAAWRGSKYDTTSGQAFSVHGNTVYRIGGSGSSVALTGTLDTSSGRVILASGLSSMLLVDGTSGYVINTSSLTVTKITDSNFPSSPVSCACYNGQFIVVKGGTDRWYMSAVDDGATWTPIISGRAITNGDQLLHVEAVKDVVYFFGSYSIEPWYTSSIDPYLQPITGSVLQVGLTNRDVISRIDDAILFHGRSEKGRGTIWSLIGGQISKTTPPYVEDKIGDWTFGTARCHAYSNQGHNFFEIYNTSASAFKAWIYDIGNELWDEIDTSRQLAGAMNADVTGGPTIGFDVSNGNVYWLGNASNPYNQYYGSSITDITRILDFKVDGGISRTVNQGLRFELEVQHDSSSSFTLSATLQKSDDAGRTFDTGITISKAITNGTSAQQVLLQTPPLGSFKAGRIYRLTFTGPAARLILRRAEGLVRVGRF